MTSLLANLSLSPFWFAAIFMFVAELGDKTLYTLFLLSSRGRALPVMFGGWAAFVVQSAVAVGLGSLLAKAPHEAVRYGTAAVFVGCGLWLLFKKEEPEAADKSAPPVSGMKQFLTAFTLVFIAEWGDATQVGTAALVARLHQPFQIFVGATLGLWAGTVIAVFAGKKVGDKVPANLLRRVAGALFCTFGVLTIFRG